MNQNFSPEVKRLASILHALTCRENHDDYCGWFYGETQRNYNYKEAKEKLKAFKETGITLDQFESIALVFITPHRAKWIEEDKKDLS